MANSAVVGILRALLTADTAQFQSGLKGAASAARAWQKDFASIGQQATNAGKTLTAALTVPILGLGAASVKSFMEFEDSFSGVRKTVDASEPEFAALAQSFRNLSKEIPINVNELNKLGETAGALGIQKDKLVDFTRVMAMLGVTTNVSAQQAAESIAKIQTIFGAAGKETENFASALVDLGNKGASSEQEILALATRIASAGNTAGLSQGQVLGFAAAIANVGMEAEAGGSAMSRVFNDISVAVSKGGESLNDFARIAGMSSAQFQKAFKEDASSATLAFIEGLGNIKKAGGDLNGTINDLGFTELRQSDLLRRLAGDSNNLRTALDVSGNAWRENTALTKEAEEKFKTLKSQLTLLWNQISDVGITIGAALAPAISGLINVVKGLLPYIEGAAKWFGALPVGMQTAIIGFLALAAAIGPILFVFGQLMTGGATLLALFTKKGIVMRALGAAYAFATAPAVGLTGAMTALNAAMLANPWTLAIMALAGLVLAYRAAAKAVDEHTEAERASARQMTYGQGTYGLQAQAIDKVTASQKRLNDEINKSAAGPGSDLSQYQSADQAAAQRAAEHQKNLDEIAKRAAAAAAATQKLSEAQKKYNDEIKALADGLSGGSLNADMAKLAAAVKSLGGNISAGQLRELGEQLQEAALKGAQLDPVLEKIRQQADTNAKVWAFFTQGITANTAARQNAADLVEKISDREIQKLSELMSARQKAMQQAQDTAREASEAVMRASMTTTEFAIYQATRQRDESLKAIEPLKQGIPGVYEIARQNVLQVYDQMVVDAKMASQQTMGAFSSALANLPSVILGAIQGGGGVGKAISSSLGSALFGAGSGLNNLLNTGISNMATKVGGGFAASLATSLSAALPGIGALVGPAIAALGGKLLGALGFGGNDTKKARDAFAESLGLGDSAGLMNKLRGMGDEGAALVNEALNKIGKNDTAANTAWIQSVKDLFAETTKGTEAAAAAAAKLKEDAQAMIPTWAEAGDLAEKYGIDLAALGDKFKQGGLTDAAATIYTDFERLAAFIGDDMNEGVLRGMSDEISGLVQKALEFGGEVPKQMQPMIEKLAEMGLLVDENGVKLEGVGNLKFGETLQETTVTLIETMKELVKLTRMTMGLPAEVAESATGVTTKMTEAVSSQVTFASKAMKDVSESTKAIMESDGTTAIEAVGASAKSVLDEMASVMESTVDPAVEAIAQSVTGSLSEMASIVSGDMTAAVAGIGGVATSVISDMASLMKGEVTDAVGDIGLAAMGVFSGMREMFSEPIPVNFDVSGMPSFTGVGPSRVPGFAKGTHGEYVDFGAGTLAMLHGRERVVTEGELTHGGGGGTPSRIVIPVHLDGQQVSEIIWPHLVYSLNDAGL